ncbi:O-methyltransferase [Bacillus massilinigeriensis]|uniref:O-methyltransferase n=1 Tax=Bacillus mediterraneensis TaxID=1805474 RepID=UPI0008F85419|nr:O-methyltransferase [Bacillus mediterraneensis]
MEIKKLQDYIESLIPTSEGIFKEMEEYAAANGVPIMEPAGLEAMLQILRICQPRTILEVGTAIGYSALRMVDSLPDAMVITIERDQERCKLAKENIDKACRNKQVVLLEGDALEMGEAVSKYAPYDVIFIDAAKGQYRKFFEMYEPFLQSKGMIITDNVLFKGLVAETDIEHKRTKKLVEKINQFNRWLAGHPGYDTIIIPSGDGIAVSRKR